MDIDMFFREFNVMVNKVEKKSFLILLLLVNISIMVLINVSGCTYSRWQYTSVEEPIKNDFWSVSFGFVNIGDWIPVSEKPNHEDTSYYYIITLHEVDTTINPRVQFSVDNIEVTYSGLNQPIALNIKSEGSRGGEHVGATNVIHWIHCKSFSVPRPRPDTIYVDQDITIFYRDIDEKITSFHHLTVATLSRNRRWHIVDIIEGT